MPVSLSAEGQLSPGEGRLVGVRGGTPSLQGGQGLSPSSGLEIWPSASGDSPAATARPAATAWATAGDRLAIAQ